MRMAPSDKLTVERVTFKNRIHIDVAGDLYMPLGIDKSQKHRAIVVGHPFGGVKEQTSGLHAQKLAEMGYITLAFDASFYGNSGGEPRHIEVPEIRIEDYSAAVDFLSNHALVDPARIGVLGICGGGTIPLLLTWMQSGMTLGSASAFMITGQAMKITNLGAVKIVLGIKHFLFYVLFTVLFALLSGFAVDYFYLFAGLFTTK